MRIQLRTFILILTLLLVKVQAEAYPDFIGYGYRNCMTCHFSSGGGGPLNDYGRALFANTIASRFFVPKEIDDEKLSEKAQFFENGPAWLKPGFKFRGLGVVSNPGKEAESSRFIPMQLEVNSAILLGADDKYAFVASLGYQPRPQRLKGSTEKFSEAISREHYFRLKVNQSWWLYLGMMDKVFGLKTYDHVSYSRGKVGLGYNDQTHGILTHYQQKKYDVFVHLIAGNLAQETELRQQGASVLYEYGLNEKKAIGTSLMISANKYVGWTRWSTHFKQGFDEGTSLIGEVGLIDNKKLVGEKSSKLGSFLLTQTLINLTRGYNIFFQFEHYNEQFKAESPDQYKTGLGFLLFPMQKTEVRLMAQHERQLSQIDFVQDTWNLQGQLHVSY